MKSDPRTLAIADPSLVDDRGHHYSLTVQVTRGAVEEGLKVIWFVHRDFGGIGVPEGVRVIPVFSATMYDRYRPETKSRLPSAPDAQIRMELLQAIAEAELGIEDIVYFHTGYGDLFRAVAHLASGDALESLPFLHVCTPYDHDTMPGKDPGAAVREALHTFRTSPVMDRRLFIWAETPQLAIDYMRTYGYNVRAMPLPPPVDGVLKPPGDSERAITVLYLGAAREEKGFTLLPSLAERLHEAYGRSGRLRFVIQCSPQIIGYKPVIRDAIEQLRKWPSSYVMLLDSVMDEATYHAQMAASDVVALLYDRRSYRIRGSGIAVEAVCAGKAILTHRDTFCASLLGPKSGAAVSDVSEAAAALAEMIDQIADYRRGAHQRALEYRETNSVRRYVQRLVAQSNPQKTSAWLPSAFLGVTMHPLLGWH